MYRIVDFFLDVIQLVVENKNMAFRIVELTRPSECHVTNGQLMVEQEDYRVQQNNGENGQEFFTALVKLMGK